MIFRLNRTGSCWAPSSPRSSTPSASTWPWWTTARWCWRPRTTGSTSTDTCRCRPWGCEREIVLNEWWILTERTKDGERKERKKKKLSREKELLHNQKRMKMHENKKAGFAKRERRYWGMQEREAEEITNISITTKDDLPLKPPHSNCCNTVKEGKAPLWKEKNAPISLLEAIFLFSPDFMDFLFCLKTQPLPPQNEPQNTFAKILFFPHTWDFTRFWFKLARAHFFLFLLTAINTKAPEQQARNLR